MEQELRMGRDKTFRQNSRLKALQRRQLLWSRWSVKTGVILGIIAVVCILIGGYSVRYLETDGLPWYYFGLLLLPSLFLLEYRKTSDFKAYIRKALRHPSESGLASLTVMLQALPQGYLVGSRALSGEELRICEGLCEVYRLYMDHPETISEETWTAFETVLLEHGIIK